MGDNSKAIVDQLLNGGGHLLSKVAKKAKAMKSKEAHTWQKRQEKKEDDDVLKDFMSPKGFESSPKPKSHQGSALDALMKPKKKTSTSDRLMMDSVHDSIVPEHSEYDHHKKSADRHQTGKSHKQHKQRKQRKQHSAKSTLSATSKHPPHDDLLDSKLSSHRKQHAMHSRKTKKHQPRMIAPHLFRTASN